MRPRRKRRPTPRRTAGRSRSAPRPTSAPTSPVTASRPARSCARRPRSAWRRCRRCGPAIVERLPREQRRAFRLAVADPAAVQVELAGDRATAGLAPAAAGRKPMRVALVRAGDRWLIERARGPEVMRSQRGQGSAEYMGVLPAGGRDRRRADRRRHRAEDRRGDGRDRSAASPTGRARRWGSATAAAPVPERVSGRPPASDRDGDGISNQEEREQGSDPENTDTDADGLTDGEEKRTGGDPTRSRLRRRRPPRRRRGRGRPQPARARTPTRTG